MEVSILAYPKKSHRREFVLPRENVNLAELLGIIAGDGGISSDWQLRIYLNSITDKDYAPKVCNLIYSLFDLNPSTRIRPRENTLIIDVSNIGLIDFLVNKGAIKGNKVVNGVDMPVWIVSDIEYSKAFIRGVFDTDGCTFYDRHKYRNKTYQHLGIAFTNKSELLLESIFKKLKLMGYHPTLSTKYRIMLRREKEIFEFFQDIIPSNPRHWDKLNEFKEEYRSGRNGTVSKAVVRATGP